MWGKKVPLKIVGKILHSNFKFEETQHYMWYEYQGGMFYRFNEAGLKRIDAYIRWSKRIRDKKKTA